MDQPESSSPVDLNDGAENELQIDVHDDNTAKNRDARLRLDVDREMQANTDFNNSQLAQNSRKFYDSEDRAQNVVEKQEIEIMQPQSPELIADNQCQRLDTQQDVSNNL